MRSTELTQASKPIADKVLELGHRLLHEIHVAPEKRGSICDRLEALQFSLEAREVREAAAMVRRAVGQVWGMPLRRPKPRQHAPQNGGAVGCEL